MRPFFWLYFVLLILWLLTVTYCHSLCNCGIAAGAIGAAGTTTSAIGAASAVGAVGAAASTAAPLRNIAIADSDRNYTTQLNDNLLFPQSDCMYESPISDSLSTTFQSLADHLNANETRILVLTGLYQNAETNNCTANNLGLGRAETVRQLLVDKGAPASQINLAASNENLIDLVDDKIMGGVRYSFISGDLTDVEQRLRDRNNITLYFGTNQDDIFLDEEQIEYFNDLKYYLNRNTSAQALVIGHTDDEGSASGNRRLSRKRAERVRDFMTEKDIDADQIVAKGMGPNEPIATNDTEEGRSLNRRVEITLK